MIPRKKRRLTLVALLIVALVGAAVVLLITATHYFRSRSGINRPTAAAQNTGNGNSSINVDPANSTPNSSSQLDRARQLIRSLRSIAEKTDGTQALSYESTALFKELQSFGADAVTASLDEIADKTSPEPLRILLIEMIATLDRKRDGRVGRVLMAIITDPGESKTLRMQALQWIPETGDQTSGAELLEILPKQIDADLEFGITRSLRGFKIPGSVDVLAAELADEKSHLIRIAAYHALAKQSDTSALKVLQKSVAEKLAEGSQESQSQENAVAVHGVLALGELPDPSSLALLESIAKNPRNSVSVRSTAFDAIAAIGGPGVQEILRRALKDEANESVLVYVARALAIQGDASDAPTCLAKAEMVSDAYTKSELQRAARTLNKKG